MKNLKTDKGCKKYKDKGCEKFDDGQMMREIKWINSSNKKYSRIKQKKLQIAQPYLQNISQFQAKVIGETTLDKGHAIQ